MRKHLILSSLMIASNMLYAGGGTIVIKNMSDYAKLASCRASNTAPYTADEVEKTHTKVKETLYYYNVRYDESSYDKDDAQARPWATPYSPQLDSCGFDHKQPCDSVSFYDKPFNGGRTKNTYKYGNPRASLFNPYIVYSDQFQGYSYLALSFLFDSKGDFIKSFDSQVDEFLMKRHVIKSSPLGYDKFLGYIAKNGTFAQSYSAMGEFSGKNGAYSNVECNIVDSTTGYKLGVVGGLINTYETNMGTAATTIPFISGKEAKDKFSVLVVKSMPGPYNYTKLKLIDRITKPRGDKS